MHQLENQRHQQQYRHQHVDDDRDRLGEQAGPVAAAQLQGLPQLTLDARAEDHADDQRQHRQPESAHHQAQQAEHQQQRQIQRLHIDCERTQRGEEQDARVQVGPRGAKQLGPQRCQRQVEHQQQEVADEQAGDQRPDQQRLLLEQRWAGLDSV